MLISLITLPAKTKLSQLCEASMQGEATNSSNGSQTTSTSVWAQKSRQKAQQLSLTDTTSPEPSKSCRKCSLPPFGEKPSFTCTWALGWTRCNLRRLSQTSTTSFLSTNPHPTTTTTTTSTTTTQFNDRFLFLTPTSPI